MRNNVLFTAALVAGTMAAAGCGSTTSQAVSAAETPNRMNAPVTVQVTNDNPQDVNVYVTNGTTRWRLGTLVTNQTSVFTVPSSVTHSSTDLRILIHPIGGGGDYLTEPLLVNPGDQIELGVRPHLPTSALSIRSR